MAEDKDPKAPSEVKAREPGKGGNPNRGAGGRFAASPGGAGAKRKPRAAPKSTTTDAQLRKRLTELGAMAGAGVAMRDRFCGVVLLEGVPGVADALIDASKESPALRRSLESITVASVWGGVVTAVAGIAVPIAWHHGLIPGQVMNVLDGAGVVKVPEPAKAVAVAEQEARAGEPSSPDEPPPEDWGEPTPQTVVMNDGAEPPAPEDGVILAQPVTL